MEVTVNPDRCMRCGFCETIVPEVFYLDGTGHAQVLLKPVPIHLRDLVYQAAEECPEGAISVQE